MPRVVSLLLPLALALAACSDSVDSPSAGPGGRDVTAPNDQPASAPADQPGGEPGAVPETPRPGPTAAPPTAPPPETGVPGLDSADAFCAAWSRYAGSFQVVAVASSFLVDEPRRAFELELAAAHVIVAAYSEMGANWPDELAVERRTALAEAFGPFAARAERAAAMLVDTGADPATVEAISAAWLAALAARNPEQPDVQLALDPAVGELLAAAADAMYDTTGPLYADPALVTDVATPATDAYLSESCPDRGALAGGEVG